MFPPAGLGNQRVRRPPGGRRKEKMEMAEKILLVEDEEKLARMVEMELRYEGYEVTKAFDGRSGL